MKKLVVGILIGLLAGAGVTWVTLRPHGGTAAESPKAEAAKPPEKEKENPLRLNAAKRTAAGITLAKAAEAALTSEVAAFGRVLDATSMVALGAEAETARVAAGATEKELDRAKKLFAAGGNASAQMVETAEANAARDRTAVASAQARLLTTWGREVAKNFIAINQALVAGASLARLDVLPGDPVGAAPKTAHLALAGSKDVFEAEVLGPSPVADPQVQGASFLVLLRGHSLPAGAALRGTLPGIGAAVPAFVVPRGAVVYHQGSAWVFVLGEEDTFERKLVSLGRAIGDDGVAVTQGVDAAEQIVTTGAQQLLAAELQAGGAPEAD